MWPTNLLADIRAHSTDSGHVYLRRGVFRYHVGFHPRNRFQAISRKPLVQFKTFRYERALQQYLTILNTMGF